MEAVPDLEGTLDFVALSDAGTGIRAAIGLLLSELRCLLRIGRRSDWEVVPTVRFLADRFLRRFAATDVSPRECSQVSGPTSELIPRCEYLSATDLPWYELHVRGNLVFDAHGRPFDTRHLGDPADRAIFVWTTDRRLYAARGILGQFHHSSFLAGAPVIAAGELMVVRGRIILVSDRSGHYLPQTANLLHFLRWLVAAGVPAKQIAVEKVLPFDQADSGWTAILDRVAYFRALT